MTSAPDGPAVGLAEQQVVVAANVAAPLDGVPFHRSSRQVERLAPHGFPFHIAVHRLCAPTRPARYVDPHVHPAGEVNVLLGAPGALEYDYVVGDQHRRVSSPEVVWLPAGVPHAATVARGTGTFVCAILTRREAAFGPVVDPRPALGAEPLVSTSDHGPGEVVELSGGDGGTIAVSVAHHGTSGHWSVWVPPGVHHRGALDDVPTTLVRIVLRRSQDGG